MSVFLLLLRPMSTSPNSLPVSSSPEQFAAYLRARTEDAVAVSVHHASLAQQYLTLSQKFAALAEQAAAGHLVSLVQTVRALEREASTGTPADPIGVPQVSVPIPTSFNSTSKESPADPAVPLSADLAPSNAEKGTEQSGRSPADTSPAFFSPPARFSESRSLSEISGELPSSGAKDAASGFTGQPETGPTASSAEKADPATAAGAATATAPRKRPARKRLIPRTVVERARRVVLETTERVRVKPKKSDLKPQLRTTTEEITEELRRSRTPAIISLVVTAIAMLILAIKQLEFFEEEPLPPLIAGFSDQIEDVEESLPIEPPAKEVGEQQEQPAEEPVEEMVEEAEPMPDPLPEPAPVIEMADAALPETPDGTAPSSPEPTAGTELGAVSNRTESGRKMLLEKFGGSAASESAVGFALEWLAARQRPNGTWDFNDVGPCTHQGSANNPIGGTAYALLPFLAAGQTHREGQYRRQVQAGLEFLMQVGVSAPAGYDLRGVVNKADRDVDPNYAYYVHGAATLVLCEAYGMTKDRKLKAAAEGAVLFLINSQDRRGGGWRYNPQQPGSTSATAIQVMALRAAEKAGIRIPDATWKGAAHYFDSVSIDREGRYGYEVEKKFYAISVTSMALLSRMSLGWGRDDGDMRAGVALIDKRGPYDNLYYNYFATQVMKNWGGPEWERWNGRLRDDLIAWQETDGPAKGSWTPRDRAEYSRAGGRLLTTCLAALTLEVYYRYQPMLPEADKTSLTAEADAKPM